MLRPDRPGRTKRQYKKQHGRSRAKKNGKIMDSCGKLRFRRRINMTGTEDLCTCAGSSVGEANNQPALCTQCGKKIPGPKQFSDSMLEATYEILAEEGAIGSGAR
jgi:hypothetical protein